MQPGTLGVTFVKYCVKCTMSTTQQNLDSSLDLRSALMNHFERYLRTPK